MTDFTLFHFLFFFFFDFCMWTKRSPRRESELRAQTETTSFLLASTYIQTGCSCCLIQKSGGSQLRHYQLSVFSVSFEAINVLSWVKITFSLCLFLDLHSEKYKKHWDFLEQDIKTVTFPFAGWVCGLRCSFCIRTSCQRLSSFTASCTGSRTAVPVTRRRRRPLWLPYVIWVGIWDCRTWLRGKAAWLSIWKVLLIVCTMWFRELWAVAALTRLNGPRFWLHDVTNGLWWAVLDNRLVLHGHWAQNYSEMCALWRGDAQCLCLRLFVDLDADKGS